MMMVELTTVPSAVLPVPELADHLRLSRGFADDGDQDSRLQSCLRAAASAIEARIGKALFRRRFMLTVTHWYADGHHILPIAPVDAVESVTLITRVGSENVLAPEAYRLVPDAHAPMLAASGARLPALSSGGTAEVVFTAGYAADWGGLPSDLRQAMLIQAGEFFGQTHDAGQGIAFSVSVLLEPYRALRLRGVGAGTGA